MRTLFSKFWACATWPHRKWRALVDRVLSRISNSRFFLVIPIGAAALMIWAAALMARQAFGSGPQGGLERTNAALKAVLALTGLFFSVNETIVDLIRRRKRRSALAPAFRVISPLESAMTESSAGLDAIGSMENVDLTRAGAEPDADYRPRLIAKLRGEAEAQRDTSVRDAGRLNP